MDTEKAEAELARIGEEIFKQLIDGSYKPHAAWRTEGKGTRTVMFPEVVPDKGPLAQAFGVMSMSVDSEFAYFVSDAWGATKSYKTNGEIWGPGEMEYAVDHKTKDAHLVYEQLVIVMTDRSEQMSLYRIKYTRDDDGKPVMGDKQVRHGMRDVMMVDDIGHMLSKSMALPKIEDTLAGLGISLDAFSMSQEEMQMHSTCAAIKEIMKECGFPCGVFTYTPMETEVVKKSLDNEEMHAQYGIISGTQEDLNAMVDGDRS